MGPPGALCEEPRKVSTASPASPTKRVFAGLLRGRYHIALPPADEPLSTAIASIDRTRTCRFAGILCHILLSRSMRSMFFRAFLKVP
jgi:hypothetical protein